MIQTVVLAIGIQGEVAVVRINRQDGARGQAHRHRLSAIDRRWDRLTANRRQGKVVALCIAVVAEHVVAHWVRSRRRRHLVVFGHRRIVLAVDDDGHRSLGSAVVAIGHRVHEGLGSRLALAERVILAGGIEGVLTIGIELDRHAGGEGNHLADICCKVLDRLDGERIVLGIDVVGQNVVGHRLILRSALGIVVCDGVVVIAVYCNCHGSKVRFTVSIANGVGKCIFCCFTRSQRFILIRRIKGI